MAQPSIHHLEQVAKVNLTTGKTYQHPAPPEIMYCKRHNISSHPRCCQNEKLQPMHNKKSDIEEDKETALWEIHDGWIRKRPQEDTTRTEEELYSHKTVGKRFSVESLQIPAVGYCVLFYLGKCYTVVRKVANRWWAFWAWLMPILC